MTFKFNDIIKILPDAQVEDRTLKAKLEMIDSALAGDTPKGLYVTFELSRSGKRINGRIYPPWGQRDNVDSWVAPYQKPILVHHDKTGEPIGRFVNVEWVSTEDEALEHIGNVSDFMEVRGAFASRNPQKIFKVMDRHNLLADRKWPGLGKLMATARINDPDAIAKFLDGRYQTFSAGQTTDAMTCMDCGEGIGDCEHRPGMLNDDGIPVTFMTGNTKGNEGSVVNMPANDTSAVESMQLVDSLADADTTWNHIKTTDYLTTDSVMAVGEVAEVNDKPQAYGEAMNGKIQPGMLSDGAFVNHIADALSGDTHLETEWLIRIHDALHNMYDFRLKYADEGDDDFLPMPADVLKLHGSLHDISTEKNFRGSLINGPLDTLDESGAASEKYVMRRPAEDAQETTMELTDKQIDELFAEFEKRSAAVSGELKDSKEEGDAAIDDSKADEGSVLAAPKEEEKEEKIEEVVTADTLDLDWFVLDMALSNLLGDAKLSAEALAALTDDQFCGPGRTFPVANAAHVVAAHRLLDSAKLDDDDKAELLVMVDGKVIAVETDEVKDAGIADLTQDYAESIKANDGLKSMLIKVLESHATAKGHDFSEIKDEEKLDSLTAWFDNVSSTDDSNVKGKTLTDIKAVDNPGVDSSFKPVDNKELDDFTKDFITKFRKIVKEDGQVIADNYFRRNRKYLPNSFNPETLIE